MRRHRRKGGAFNFSGSQGIRFEFTNEKRLIIGTEQPEEFLQALKRIVPNTQ